jgi:hypothetical protein
LRIVLAGSVRLCSRYAVNVRLHYQPDGGVPPPIRAVVASFPLFCTACSYRSRRPSIRRSLSSLCRISSLREWFSLYAASSSAASVGSERLSAADTTWTLLSEIGWVSWGHPGGARVCANCPGDGLRASTLTMPEFPSMSLATAQSTEEGKDMSPGFRDGPE